MSDVAAMSERALPSVSVLLPAWNEASTLGRCLDSLLAIPWPDLEIILCAGGNDGTVEIAKRYAAAHPHRIVFLEQRPGEGKQAALRRCYECSRGEVIYLTDADCVIPAETLERMVRAVASGESDAATGPAEPLPEQRHRAWIRHQWATIRAVDRQRPPEATGILGRNCAVRRAAVEATGGFTEPVAIGTDYHFAKRLLSAGMTIRFVSAPVQTHFAESIGDYLGQQSRWLRNILVHGPRFGDRAEVAAIIKTVSLGTGLLFWPLTWRWTRLPGIGLWALTLGWMTKARLRQQRSLEAEMGLRRSGEVSLLVSSALFSLVDLVAWARPAFDLLSPKRRLRW
ncbi:MAG TPA: glycosyltransferase [Thermomicrobiales bacterium]